MKVLFLLIAVSMLAGTRLEAQCDAGHATCGPVINGYGPYAQGPTGWGVGRFGAVRPAWYGPYGRYPKLGFAAPVRRAFGLPGYTPVRQFLFGRGAIRRQTRRACLFGGC